MQKELGHMVDEQEVKNTLIEQFEQVFDTEIITAANIEKQAV